MRARLVSEYDKNGEQKMRGDHKDTMSQMFDKRASKGNLQRKELMATLE